MRENKKNIILVDDHIVVRTALKELITKFGPYHVAKEFDNGKTFLQELPNIQNVDLVLLDISMPVLDGIDTLIKLKETGMQVHVLILTDNDDDDQAIKVFKLGARGYLRKNCTAGQLGEALKEIFEKGYCQNQFFTNSLLSEGSTTQTKHKFKILENLTEKEKEFLKLVCDEEEYTYSQIATKMKLHLRQIDKVREDLFAKLNVKSKTGLVLYVIHNKLLSVL